MSTELHPLVSIIVPAHNSEAFIESSLESALAQTYPNIEVIVVNDGSTDRTSLILERYSDRIQVLDQTNQGAGVARNTGIRQARGKYIAFLDADDLWVESKLELQVQYLQQNPDIHAVYNQWLELYPNETGAYILPELQQPDADEEIRINKDLSGWLYNKLLMDCILHTSSVLVSRSIVETVGNFDPAFRKGQDYDYWLRLSRKTQIAKLDYVLSFYRINKTSITNRPADINYNAKVLGKAIDRFGLTGPDGVTTSKKVIRKRLAKSWYYFALQQYSVGNYPVALKGFMSSISKGVISLKCCAYIPLSLFRSLFS